MRLQSVLLYFSNHVCYMIMNWCWGREHLLVVNCGKTHPGKCPARPLNFESYQPFILLREKDNDLDGISQHFPGWKVVISVCRLSRLDILIPCNANHGY